MAIEWDWDSAAEKTWWAVLSHSPKEMWALQSLYGRYLKEKNTLGIRQIASHLLKIEPTNERAQNDFAMSSLLLDREVDRAKALAISLHKKNPNNVAYASTYAFSLLAEGRAVDALHIFEALPATELETPEVAAYYGMVLVANGAPEKARHFLDIARGGTLLPEEQAWLAKAERQIPLPKQAKP
jgi:predicted Zn-dependent protease